MAAPAYNYKGNNDFRGWLAANDNLSWLNSHVGNDGRINQNLYSPQNSKQFNQIPYRLAGYGSANNFQSYVSGLYNDFNQAKSYNDQYQSLLSAINANRTPTPRFVNYDITGSWNKAREMATQAVSPIYQQKMTDFVNRQTQELGRKREDVSSGKSALDLALGRLMQDTQLTRTRTEEDTTKNIGDINAAQAFNARQEGLSFDEANRSLNENLGATGMATSGLGQQRVAETQGARREMSNEQVRQTENKVEATRTLMTRTFQDLETKETRSTEDTATGKAKLDLDLERFIQDQAYEKDQTSKQLELEKAADIAQKSIGIQGQLVDQWIASLAGKGYTAQEIANAASIYK